MTASAKFLQNIYRTGIFNPCACEVNVGNTPAALAEASSKGLIWAKPARDRGGQLFDLGNESGSLLSMVWCAPDPRQRSAE
jgi:hypothetical protein